MSEQIQVIEGERPPENVASVTVHRNSALGHFGGSPYVAAGDHPKKIKIYVAG
jgi:hypothetical protein